MVRAKLNNGYAEFECGCRWKVIEEGEPPLLDFNVYDAPRNCPATWKLISDGYTVGIFQLESSLGQQWAKQLKPEHLEHMSALGSLLRPGCLRAYDENGISMTKHFCLRKNGEEEPTAFHPLLEPILRKTYQIMAYQEQSLAIVNAIGGFSLSEADSLRRAIGKKKTDDMAKVEKEFIIKAQEFSKISEEEAKQIFSYIKASQRYLFNKCLSLDSTVISLSRGKINITEVEVGDEIYAPRFCKSVPEIPVDNFVKILGKHYNKEKKHICCVVFENGRSIKCTVDHKFLCRVDGKLQQLPLYACLMRGVDVFSYYLEPIAIKTVIPIGEQYTIDLEVDDPLHCFYADSFAVSNSHSASYGERGYFMAYAKAHVPVAFYTSGLHFCKDQQDSEEKIEHYIEEGKLLDIHVEIPDLRDKELRFYNRQSRIKFGLTDVKNIGDSTGDKLLERVCAAEAILKKSVSDFSWYELCVEVLMNIGESTAKALIYSGALSWFGLAREKQVFDLKNLNDVFKTPKEVEWLEANKSKATAVFDLIKLASKPKKEGGAASTKNRLAEMESIIKLIESPTSDKTDEPTHIALKEKHYLGVPITFTKIDSCDINVRTTTCKDFLGGFGSGPMILAGEIKVVKEHTTKRGNNPGQKMAFLTMSDGTGTVGNVIVFPQLYQEAGNLLIEENLVVITGKRGKDDSFIAEKIIQAV